MVDLPEDEGAYSVEGLLRIMCSKHAAAEDLAYDYCGDRLKPKFCQLEFPVGDMPQVLVFQLRRFRESGRRTDKVLGTALLPLATEYFSLCAILQHVRDGVNSGHYITTIRHGD